MNKKVIYSILGIILLSLISCEKDNQGTQGKTIGSIFSIDLVSNPTTGYSWKWTNKQEITIVDSIDHCFIPFYPYRKGSPGIETWKFIGKEKGTESLEFIYNRWWIPDSIIDRKIVTITVK